MIAWLAFTAADVRSQEVHVAVASNAAAAIHTVAEAFESTTEVRVVISPGSSGKHFAQIQNGAPFHVFLSADTLRPALMERDGTGVPGSRFTYACGRLVLWSPDSTLVDPDGRVLTGPRYRFLAIANPRLAPYGSAAQEVLEGLSLWDRLQTRIVRGENVAQAFQYTVSGSAELGFVSQAQLEAMGSQVPAGSFWNVPDSLYTPLRQQAVLLRGTPEARSFMEFLGGEQSSSILESFGYTTPGSLSPTCSL
jgi:molybdate transport system substrate-binding protein